MGRIQGGRVILGGLVAGLVINVGMFLLHGAMLKNDWQSAMQALGHVAEPSDMTRSLVIFNLQGFLVGLFAVWLYAAIRPRYGAGPGTAARAGVAAWFGASLAPTLIQMALRLLPDKLLYVPLVGDFVILIIAVIAGAALYKESPAGAAAASAA